MTAARQKKSPRSITTQAWVSLADGTCLPYVYRTVATLSNSRNQLGMYRARWLTSHSRQVVNHFCNLGGSLGSTVEKRKLPSLFFFHTLNAESYSANASFG